jgi:hypothetical protein
MNSTVIVRISKTQDLEIPLDIKHQLQPDSEYEMTFNQEEIIFKKITPSVTNQSSSFCRHGSGKSLLRQAGTWQGDDFEDCLQAVYKNRSQIASGQNS